MADQNFVVKLKEYRLNAVLDTVVPVLGPAGPPGPPGPPGATGPPGPPGPVTPWTQNADAAGFNLSNVGQLTVQGSATAGNMVISQPAGTGSVLHLESALSDRWTVAKDAIAETGSNAGSNFFISRYSDSGVLLGTPLTIARSTGVVNFAQTPTIAGLPIISVSQTPWLSDIDGAGFTLKNVGKIGVGNDATVLPDADGATYLTVGSATGTPVGAVTVCGNTASGAVGAIQFANYAKTGSDKRIGLIIGATDGSLDSGRLVFSTYNLGTYGEKMRITTTGLVGIGVTPAYKLDVAGDCNLSAGSVYRVNGVPISTGGAAQTPWTSDIDGAGFTLRNAGKIGIGMAVPPQSLLQLGSSAVTGYPTYRGSLIISEYSASLAANMGLEFHTRGDSGGYGWRLSSLANNTDFVFESRSASAAWTERMRILNNGNVGIGTTSPQSSLHILSASASPSVTYHAAASLNLEIVGGIELAFGGINANPWPSWLQSRGSGNSANPLALNPLGGNVGIGTASPQAKLAVYGHSSAPSTSGPAGLIRIEGDAGGNVLDLGIYPTAPYGMWIQATDRNVPAATYPLVLQPLGNNVGIGNANPAYKLDVAGDVNCSGVFRVAGLPTPRVTAFLDRTGARALNTVYQNNVQGCPIFVAITLTINQSQFAQLLTDLGNPPSLVVCTQSNASGSFTINQTLNGWVMPNHFYKVNAPSATLITWFEWA